MFFTARSQLRNEHCAAHDQHRADEQQDDPTRHPAAARRRGEVAADQDETDHNDDDLHRSRRDRGEHAGADRDDGRRALLLEEADHERGVRDRAADEAGEVVRELLAEYGLERQRRRDGPHQRDGRRELWYRREKERGGADSCPESRRRRPPAPNAAARRCGECRRRPAPVRLSLRPILAQRVVSRRGSRPTQEAPPGVARTPS